MQILLLEPFLEGMRNFVKPPQMTGTSLWNMEMIKLSLFPAGTPCIDAELRGFNAIFSKKLTASLLNLAPDCLEAEY